MFQALILVVIILVTFFVLQAAKREKLTYLEIKLPDRDIKFEVEVADTLTKKALGLMYRKHLPENRGMLFIYDREGFHSFWMKNTYIPLDIVFISSEKKIVDIVENTEPLSTKPINSRVPFQYALEILAGSVKKHGIQVGQKVKFD